MNRLNTVWQWCLRYRVVTAAIVGGVLGLWEYLSFIEFMNPFIWIYLPPPSRISTTFFELLISPPNWRFNPYYQLTVTLYRTFAALLIGIVFAVPMGLVMGWYPRVSKLFTPIVEFVRPTPGIIILPVFILLLGSGSPSTIATSVVAVFWLMLINAIYGAQSVDKEMVRVMRTMEMGDFELFKSVIFPQSLPFIAAGIRNSLGASLMVVIAVEIVAGSKGLGAMIEVARSQLNSEVLYVGMVLSLIIGFSLIQGWIKLERILMPWYFER